MKEVDKLLFSILRVCMNNNNETSLRADLDLIEGCRSNLELWKQLNEILWISKIEAYMSFALRSNKMLSILPDNFAQVLFQAYASTCIKNRRFVNRTSEIILELNKNNITPALWKGLILAFNYYPDFGARSMSDVDFYIPIKDKERSLKVLKEMGFSEANFLSQSEDCFNGVDSSGNLIDVHFCCEFFENQKYSEIYSEYSEMYYEVSDSSSIKGRFLNLEPNAFLALLVEHQRGHMQKEGLFLNFIVDLMFFYKVHRKELNHNKLSKLLNSPQHWKLLNRADALILELCPEFELPFNNSKQLANSAFSIAEFRRSRVFGYLGLTSRYRAWVRLFLCWFGLVKKKILLTPDVNDVFCRIRDIVKENVRCSLT